jgi:hypothetical protein
MIGYDIYDCFTTEHFRLHFDDQNFLLATVLMQRCRLYFPGKLRWWWFYNFEENYTVEYKTSWSSMSFFHEL